MLTINGQQRLDIISIIIDCAEEKIDIKTAGAGVARVEKDYPIRNMKQEVKKAKDYLAGRGYSYYKYGAGFAKAFLEITNNDPEVIKALREQQALYLEKDGKNNGKLERVLDGL